MHARNRENGRQRTTDGPKTECCPKRCHERVCVRLCVRRVCVCVCLCLCVRRVRMCVCVCVRARGREARIPTDNICPFTPTAQPARRRRRRIAAVLIHRRDDTILVFVLLYGRAGLCAITENRPENSVNQNFSRNKTPRKKNSIISSAV